MAAVDGAWVVIPAFDEAASGVVGRTVADVRRAFPNVVVVDDCSSDATGDQALAAGAHVCRHAINLGQGAALATGIRYALERGAEIVVTFDADGQHRVADALAMIDRLRETGVDVVLGSRFLGRAVGMSERKRLFLRLATAFTRVTSGLPVTDTHNGLRVLSARAARAIVIRQNRMAHASEILDEIRSRGLAFVEHPVEIAYTDYSMAKGQRMSGAFAIVADLTMRKLYR
ncbi:glycosyltransferase family 2 protein [Salinarimonas sp.]|uniref:glycosyltransferase family 2 protein n=1 Tax=Salinarimonas sp. TaxID=2766526 RepID=UPI00391CA8C9